MATTETEKSGIVEAFENHYAVRKAREREGGQVYVYAKHGEIFGESIFEIGRENGYAVRWVSGDENDGGLSARFDPRDD